MDAIRLLLLLGVAASATWVVREREALSQILALNFLGLILGLTFFALEAPDVALAEIAVGAAAQPLVYLAVHSRLRRKAGTRGGVTHEVPGTAAEGGESA